MEARELKKFEQSDLEQHKMLKLILSKGNFELKGDAVARVAALFSWFSKLETKIEDTLKQQALDKVKPGKVKPLDNK